MATQYVALDVHKSMTKLVAHNENGEPIGESEISTTEQGLIAAVEGYNQRQGDTEVVFEESSKAQWLYEILSPHADRVVACHPADSTPNRGSKTDTADAHRLAKLCRMEELTEVRHGSEIDTGLKTLVHNYIQVTSGLVRAKNQLKAVYRSRNIECGGDRIYNLEARDRWLEKLTCSASRMRARQAFERVELFETQKQQAQEEMLEAARKRDGYDCIRTIPGLGAIRTAKLMGLIGDPCRFEGKRKLWRYSCLAVVVSDSGHYEKTADGFEHKKRLKTRGLNRDGKSDLKRIFVGAAGHAIRFCPEIEDDFDARCEDKSPDLARLDIARKLASQALTLWKRKDTYDVDKARWKTTD